MYGLPEQSFFYLTTGESDTPFGFSNARAGIIIAILVLAIILFYVTLKIYDMVKHKHWSERDNRIRAVKDLLHKSRKDIKELEGDDLISNNLVTLYEYYDRRMDKMVQDLGKEFENAGPGELAKIPNTKD